MPDPLNNPIEAHRQATYAYVEAFFSSLVASGVEAAFVSPGSRSTPLALTAARTPGLRLHMVLDERSAGFLALGWARQMGRPAVLICTSGTAAANYLPAVTEAHHGRVPMVVLTADRPPELREWGAGQTIDQVGIYGTAVRRFTEMPSPGLDFASVRHAEAAGRRAVGDALGLAPGPVHLNWPFREPLEPPTDPGPQRAHPREWVPPLKAEVNAGEIETVVELMTSVERGWIVCGPMPPCRERDGHLAHLARVSGWPVLADPLSGLRRGHHVEDAPVLAHSDLWLREEMVRARSAPRMILRFGDAPTSKSFRLALEAHPPEHMVLVDGSGQWGDPGHRATHWVRGDPAQVAADLAERLPGRSIDPHWAQALLEIDRRVAVTIDESFEAAAIMDELHVVMCLERSLRDDCTLFVSSSMPIRDVDAVLPVRREPLRILANRGANGIDGVTSTALGAALGDCGPVVLLIGDLALLHDLGGLLSARNHAAPLLIVVLNNDGGGIFSFLPIAEQATRLPFEELFRTPHGLTLRRAADLFELPFEQVDREDRLEDVVRAWLESGLKGPRIVEVPIDRESHVARFRGLVKEAGRVARAGLAP
ncbi:MAG: 2-succinyl-5-enolpyruvyl-6-hydroxy-3-cyclohexene-1-carboxylic-acid synthase [bacterium TMED88]|nr:2-succinyl-5-enolpyruvyl-6-hydroxy-3-cyclohexene-1-carboxylic-acid synthase [Deltaproteobacteria bacterium]OUV32321.1 MAG: 2-succinyl-5-enolpyruvyl-6-hydroxy-3-cyclohexene-1-carboxylic-acid synthase [bacterium TMED88]